MERLIDCRNIKVGMHLMYIDKKMIAIDTVKKVDDTARKPSKKFIEYRADYHTCLLNDNTYNVKIGVNSKLGINIDNSVKRAYILTEQEYKENIDALMRIKHIKEMCDTSIKGLFETIMPPKEEDNAQA